jgi:hypothetical protein
MVYMNASYAQVVPLHALHIGGIQIDILDLLFYNKLTDGLLTLEMNIHMKELNKLLMMLD